MRKVQITSHLLDNIKLMQW